MNVFRITSSGILITNSHPDYFAGMLHLQDTLNPPAPRRFSEADLTRHAERLPPGQYVALDAERVVGMANCLQVSLPPSQSLNKSWLDVVGDTAFSAHEQAGKWLFGASLLIHPDYLEHGIGSELYTLRMALAKTLELVGFYEFAPLNGYTGETSLEEYASAVIAGSLTDIPASAALNRGYKAQGINPSERALVITLKNVMRD